MFNCVTSREMASGNGNNSMNQREKHEPSLERKDPLHTSHLSSRKSIPDGAESLIYSLRIRRCLKREWEETSAQVFQNCPMELYANGDKVSVRDFSKYKSPSPRCKEIV